MKRLFTLSLLALVLGVTGASAQSLRKTWDFRDGFSQRTINALKGDQEEFGDSKYWRNYESDATKADEQHYWNASKEAKNGDGFACTHNGGQEKVIPELDGLVLGMSNAKKFVVTYNGAQSPNEFESEGGPALGEPIPHGNSYVWLNGKNETIAFQAEVNQTIKIGVESHAVNRTKLGEARGISLSTSAGSLELTAGNPVPTYYTECEWELTGNDGDVATVTLKSTNGCHIYYIIVGEGDDPNANKTQVGYVTAGDATTEAAYQTLAADENCMLTALDAASLTADQLQAYQVTVVSPALPADNAAVSVLKNALTFAPIVNLNPALYAAWGYGEAYDSGLPIGLVTDQKNSLFAGFAEDAFFMDGDAVVLQLAEASTLQAIHLGDFFEGDQMPLVDGNDPTAPMAHVHNPFHNAYIYVPFADDANDNGKQLLLNAVEMAKGSKTEVTQAPAPKITLSYKDQHTIVTLAMASSTLPKPQIFYTTDGSTPNENSTRYTEPFTVYNPTYVKAAALAEGYLLSEPAEAYAEIFSQPATPSLTQTYEDGHTVVEMSCTTPGVDIWYNFLDAIEEPDTAKSMKYTEPFSLSLPTTVNVFAVAGQQVYSEVATQRVVVKNVKVRQDQIGLFDANADDWQNGGGSTVYYFSWGKSARSIYDTTQEGTTTTDPETGDEITVYPELDYEYYVPANEANYWEVKSKGQVMIYQVLTAGMDPGNPDGYNPETSGDIVSYAGITKNDIQFGGKTSGEPCTGMIQSLKKFQGPFDVLTYVGTAAGGDNVGRMQLQVSTDSLEWTNLGDEMRTSTVKRLWKSYTRSYEGTDEVYVRITQAGGGSSVQIYNMYILNEGEQSLALKEQYEQEFRDIAGDGIADVQRSRLGTTAIYNINGTRVSSLHHGLNIVVGTDGTAKKVMK